MGIAKRNHVLVTAHSWATESPLVRWRTASISFASAFARLAQAHS
jgi:hypothetical protein